MPKAALKRTVEDVFFQYSDEERDGAGRNPNSRHRDIVIVGHDIESDLRYLSDINVDYCAAFNHINTLDTQDIHQTWSEAECGRSLTYVLSDLYLPHKNLHNAGNDAAYTLQVLIALAVHTAAKTNPFNEGD